MEDNNHPTLVRHLLDRQFQHELDGELVVLLTAIQSAVKKVSAAVSRAGISKMFGTAGTTNVQGEAVKKLDIVANDIFIDELTSSYSCCLLVSEENDTAIEIESKKRGKYVVMFDPLDGSSNIDCLVSIGTIFGVFELKDGEEITPKAALKNGRNLVASGYGLYGSATMFVLASQDQVNGFMLDPMVGEFLLTDPHMQVPKKGKIFSVNEGNFSEWEKPIQNFIIGKKENKKHW